MIKNIILIIITIILFNSCSEFKNDFINNDFKKSEAIIFSDNLKVNRIIHFENELTLTNPFRILNLNDEYLLVSEYNSENFFNVLSLPELDYLYSWGTISRGPGADEYNSIPVYLNVQDGELVVFDDIQKELKYISVTDSKVLLNDRRTLSYETQTEPLNRIRRINDDLYFADYGSSFENTNSEHIAISPDNQNTLFTFGKYPDSDKEGFERYSFYLKENMAKPDGSAFGAFYFYHNMFKIYNESGEETAAVNIHDPYQEHEISTLEKMYNYRTAVWATDQFMYTLGQYYYNDEVPDDPDESNLTTSLEIWTWDGDPVFRASFDRFVSNFTVSEEFGKIYAFSSYKEDRIYEYDISDVLNEIQGGSF